MLFSATPAAVLAIEAEAVETDASSEFAGPVDSDLLELIAGECTQSSPDNHDAGQLADAEQTLELVFIDESVRDLQQLVDDLEIANQSDSSRVLEVVILDSNKDGLAQITSHLLHYGGIDGIHIVSHGNDGEVSLGSTQLSISNVERYSTAFNAWQHSLSEKADLLFYGCNLADSPDGQQLMNEIAANSGTDVAASDDNTGHAAVGADWDLEYQIGQIEIQVAFSQELQQTWANVLNVTVDATSVGTSTGGDITISHTTSGSDRLMLVGVSMNLNTSESVTSVTYDSVSATLVGTRTDGDARVEIWALVNPNQGNHNVLVTFSGTTDGNTVGVMTFNGVDQTTAVGTFASNSGIGGSGSVTANSAAGETVFGVIGVDAPTDYDLIPGGGQSEHWDLIGGLQISGGGSTKAGAGTVPMSWSWSGTDNWTAGAVSIKPVSSATTVTYQQGIGGYTGTVDTELDSGSPTTDKSANTSIVVDLDDGSGEAQGLIRFDNIFGTAAGQIPLGVQITSASLTVEVTSATTGNVNLHRMLQSWSETSTWNSLWSGLTADGTELATIADAQVTPGQGTAVFADLESTVQAWANGDANYGWGLLADSTNGWDFASSEGTIRPILSVTYVDPGSQASTAHTLTVDTATDVWDGDTSSIDALLSNKGADGFISLREAIWAANNTTNLNPSTPDVINFAIGALGSQQTINLAAALPALTDAVYLDGLSQGGGGYSGSPLIEIDGHATSNFATAGITIWTSNSTVRGLSVTGSDDEGIEIDGSSAFGAVSGNVIEHNWIGLDVSGAVDANADNGILISNNSSNNIVRNNIVSGNLGDGIEIRGTGTFGNTVTSNWIGLGIDGISDRGNARNGVQVRLDAANNTIGGTSGGQGNAIAFSGMDGIKIVDSTATGNAILGNEIHSNSGLGIDLDADGVLGNDAGDSDTGSNALQNYPVFATVNASASQVTVTGTLNSNASRSYRLEFFSGSSADASGHGEGRNYLGFVNVTTDGSGNASFDTTLTGVLSATDVVTATATALTTNDSSEFSLAVSPQMAPVVTTTGGATNWTENSSAVLIDTGATVSDVDSSDFVGGSLTIDDQANGTTDDRLAIRSEGIGAGQIGVSGSTVTYNGSTIGTFSGGSGTTPLIVTFTTSNATPTAVQALVRNITYENVSENPSTAVRSVRFVLNDGDGGTGTAAFKTVSITAVNDPPTLTSFASVVETTTEDTEVEITFAELAAQGDAADIDGTVVAFVVNNVATGTLRIGTSAGTATAWAAGTNDTIDATHQAYWTPDSNANGTQNAIDVVARDDLGAESTSDITAQVEVTPANDPPIINDQSFSVNENTTNGMLVGAISFTDPDVSDNLTLSVTGGTGATVFAVDTNTGQIAVVDQAQLNFETSPSLTLTVQVTDDGSPTLNDTATITINLNDLNDNPLFTSPSNVSVPENEVTVQTITARDEDLPAQPLTYAITGGADELTFAINPTSGVLVFLGGRDSESPTDANTDDVYEAEVTVSDGVGGSSTQTLMVTVTDVDEFDTTAITDTDAASESVPENSAGGSTVGLTAFASDADATTNTITYTLDNDAGGLFTIDGNSGVVTVNGPLDFELATSHDITVRATSADTSFTTRDFTINVTDVNEAIDPLVVDTDATADAVDENVAIGTRVGITAYATDEDTGDTVSYSLDDSAGGLFAIDPTTGIVTVDGAIDREAGASQTIIVRATSTDTSSTTRSFTIAVNDVNEFAVGTITDTDPAADSLPENASIGAPVGITAQAIDADATNNTVTYSLDNDAGGLFAIDGSTGVITVAGALDYETSSSHVLTVRATSADSSFVTSDVTVTLTDVNETGTSAITDTDPAANAVDENMAIGSAAGITAFATDPDVTDTISYSLDDSAWGLFAIDASTGVVTVNGVIDREAAASFDIIVRATSTDSTFSTQSFTIAVNDVDEFDVTPIADADAATEAVAENATVGTTVGFTALAADADATTNAITYTLTDDASGRFAIDAVTGVVTVQISPDFETSASHDIVIRATSLDGSHSTASFTIAIDDVNEAPQLTATGPFSVAENSGSGISVGSVVASDSDAGDSVSYMIVSGTPIQPFAIDASTGELTVLNTAALDYETQSTITLTVRATDSLGLTDTAVVTVNLLDLNEQPTITGFTGGAIDENRAIGSLAATVVSVDPDLGDSLTYALTDDATGRFSIDPLTGDITQAAPLNYEMQSSHSVTIEVSDAAGLTDVQTLTISVQDRNDAPVAADDTGITSQSTTLASSSGLLLLNDTDEDADLLTAVLTSGPGNGTLSLLPNGSFTYTPDSLFFGTDQFSYQASDGLSLSNVATVSLTVQPFLPPPTGSVTGSGGSSPGSTPPPGSSGGSSGSGASDAPLVAAVPPPASPVSASDAQTSSQSSASQSTINLESSAAGPTSVSPGSDVLRQLTGYGLSTNAPSVLADETREMLQAVAEMQILSVASESSPLSLTTGTRSGHVEFSSGVSVPMLGGLWVDSPGTVTNGVPMVSRDVFRETASSDQAGDQRALFDFDDTVAIGSTMVVGTSLSLGYAVWLLRGGSLITAFLSALPVWQVFDPLPILDCFRDETEEDADTLMSIASRISSAARGVKPRSKDQPS